VIRSEAIGDKGFEALFREHYGALCSFALRYVRDRAAAEDLVQGLFADIWSRGAWRARTSRPYLYAAVRNRSLNLRERTAVEEDWARDEAADEVRSLHPHPERPDHALEAAEQSRHLRDAVESLPERCRMVMYLRWRDRLTHAEIAEVMGISIKGVENQLSRGLRALRARFA
jgi:RNA polymerase sigma-70 factor, ECF subfamily